MRRLRNAQTPHRVYPCGWRQEFVGGCGLPRAFWLDPVNIFFGKKSFGAANYWMLHRVIELFLLLEIVQFASNRLVG
jgi:hypothetical protein